MSNNIDAPIRVIAGLVPATPLREAMPCRMIGVAGTSPAMTTSYECDALAENPPQPKDERGIP
jgi:hypothetical protein